MLNIPLQRRAYFYNRKFEKWPASHLMATEDGKWISGIWMIGNNYKSKKKYHGEYPPTYLDRITSLFPDASTPLHLFSGIIPKSDKYTTFDINVKGQLEPDIAGEAEKLSTYFDFNYDKKFDIIYADCPYTDEDANKYGVPLINRNVVVKECQKVLAPGGFLIWLDQVFPMHKKTDLKICGLIGMVRSTNHRVRTVFIFRKL